MGSTQPRLLCSHTRDCQRKRSGTTHVLGILQLFRYMIVLTLIYCKDSSKKNIYKYLNSIKLYFLDPHPIYVQEHVPMIGPMSGVFVSVLQERRMNGMGVVIVTPIATPWRNCAQTMAPCWQQKKKHTHG